MAGEKGLLQSVRDLLGDEGHWTQGAFARNSDGMVTTFYHSRACQWCLSGALEYKGRMEGYGIEAIREAEELLFAAIETLPLGVDVHYDSLGEFNDSVEHEFVVSALDRAIERAA